MTTKTKAEESVQTLTHTTGAANNGDDKNPRDSNKEVFVSHVKGSKAQIAQDIFNEIGGTAARKDVINRFVNEVGLSVSGASTYYQNFKSKAGMVQKRVLVTTQVRQMPNSPVAQNNSGTRGNDAPAATGGSKAAKA